MAFNLGFQTKDILRPWYMLLHLTKVPFKAFSILSKFHCACCGTSFENCRYWLRHYWWPKAWQHFEGLLYLVVNVLFLQTVVILLHSESRVRKWNSEHLWMKSNKYYKEDMVGIWVTRLNLVSRSWYFVNSAILSILFPSLTSCFNPRNVGGIVMVTDKW